MFGIELKYITVIVGLVMLVAIGTQIFWFWMMMDCWRKETDENSQRGLWLSVLMIGNIMTALIYYFLRYKRRV